MESYILPVIIALLLLYLIFTYNRLVAVRNMVDTAWANIDTLLQKRFDLVPNLVNTVKGYMDHERELFESLAKARTAWLNASSVSENAGADHMASGALKTLFAVSERYPDLKANQNFLLLQEELSGLENKIAYGRQRYNRTVMAFNTKVQRFPTNILARMFRFETRDYFAIDEQARALPKVDLRGEQ